MAGLETYYSNLKNKTLGAGLGSNMFITPNQNTRPNNEKNWKTPINCKRVVKKNWVGNESIHVASNIVIVTQKHTHTKFDHLNQYINKDKCQLFLAAGGK